MPVWVVTYKYRGKILPFAVNGQTGKTYGELPTSAGKLLAFAAIIAALALVTPACGNHRLYIGVEDYDTVQEHRATKDKGIWERLTGTNPDARPMSGSN